MTKTELLQIIEQAAEEGWTSLDLSNRGLSEIPTEVGRLIKLEVLDLSCNQISNLPYEFKKLRNLKILDLPSNQISDFPEILLELSDLQRLYLSANRIKILPPEICKLKNLRMFFLDGNQLTTLPKEIGKLTTLRFLDISANKLKCLPDEIKNLSNLEYLNLKNNPLPIPYEIMALTEEPKTIITHYFSHDTTQKGIIDLQQWFDFSKETNFQYILEKVIQNKLKVINLANRGITTFPHEFCELTDMVDLDLSYNHLTTLPDEFKKLTKLNSLVLKYNQFKTFPAVIGNLSNLKVLDFDANQLAIIPSSIESLVKLRVLRLWSNHLKSLPSELSQLVNLTQLSLGNNQLSTFYSEICKLTNLTHLSIKSNRISILPYEIKNLTNLRHLNLTGTPLPIPPEILALTNQPQKILNYYFQHIEKQTKPLNEAKVLIVGQGAVGKTSLIKRLLEDKFDPHETKTDGIAINHWFLTIDDTPIRLNLWDFGGQEIMHATHQFFLTKRSLYVLVLDSRLDDQENRVEYWLKLIQSFGGDSPVIVVCNKSDEHDLDLNWKGLQQKYPTIKAFAKSLSCKTGQGLEKLKTQIEQEVGQLEHIHDELILSWFAVKEKLEAMETDYISYQTYQQLCEAEEISQELDQQTLIGFLHDLGIVLHFHDHPRLDDTNVLNPEWVTKGVYQILNSNELFQKKGELERERLDYILDPQEYPRRKQQFILDMMRHFELCFDFEGEDGTRFLVTDLLAKEEPDTGDWSDSLAFQYAYDILPGSVISRFIVRMHTYISKRTYWRNGVVLVSEDGKNRALVKADPEEKKIFIFVSGKLERRKIFLEIIRSDFRKIHATIPRLTIKEVVPLPGHQDVLIDYTDLLKLRERGIKTYYYPKADAEINVDQLLDGIEPKQGKQTLPFALTQQITEFLVTIPNLHDKNVQQALMYGAGLDSELQQQVNVGVPSGQFVQGLVPVLLNYGRLQDGRSALIAVLQAAKTYFGQDRQTHCETLIQNIQAECD